MAKTIQEMLAGKATEDPQPVQYIDTIEAYDKWAEVYDTDGNFLQRLDSIEMRALLPKFLDRVAENSSTTEQTSAQTLADLGCGTGRNMINLLDAVSAYEKSQTDHQLTIKEVVGLDASPGMLEVAQTAVKPAMATNGLENNLQITLGIFDLLNSHSSMANLPPSLRSDGAAGVISTLVLEHIPLKEFFEATSAIMRSGAYLLVTNMHADMGMRSQAGFTDPQTGVKVRPTSYCHDIPDVLAAAESEGFRLENLVGEGEEAVLTRSVDEQLAEGLGSRAKKWVGVKVWFGICFRKV